MGLLDALNIGMRGLAASQTSIDVTGQNISNANTDGYSRKQVNQSASNVPSDIFGELGTGVDVDEIDRVRDAFLDRQTWEQMGQKGYSTQLDSAYTRIENILKEPTEDGLASKMNAFWGSWQDLANNPSDQSAREAVKSQANVLIDTFHNVYKQIEDFGLSMNNPLTDMAKQVNDLTAQIYNLNQQVSGVEARPGEKANDSRDQRDAVIRKLSDLVDIQTVEDPQGRTIITSGGSLLVGPSGAMQIETYGTNKTLSDGTQTSQLRLRFTDSRSAFEPRSGELKGIMDARTNVLSTYMTDLNALASTLVNQVNTQHQLGYNLNKSTGVNFFDPVKTTASNISLSDSVANDSNNIAAAAGGTITDVSSFAVAGGIPAGGLLDLTTINSNYRDLVSNSSEITLASGAVLQEGADKDYVVDPAAGTIRFINFAKYNPGDAISMKFSYNTTGFPGSGNGQNALDIAALRLKLTMTPDSSGNATQSISTFYGAVIGKMGIDKNQNSSALSTQTFLVSQMDNEQASIAGVNLDEEMTNMIKYENSYKASARYISTISTLMDTLMNLGR